CEIGGRQAVAMTLHLTPGMIEAAYELLRQTPPFRRWGLPDPDDLEFRAVPLPNDDQGELCKFPDGRLRLTVNPNRHKTIHSMIMTLAHEMAHMRQEQLKKKDHHGASFQRLADLVCKVHGFDRGQF